MRAYRPLRFRRLVRTRTAAALAARALPPHGEAGFALPVAIIILFIITVLTVAAITVSVQSSSSASRDSNVKAELEAAEAGIQAARYRLDQLQPKETQCITESKAVNATKENWESACKDAAEALGNGATFQYKVSLALLGAKNETCGGREVTIAKGKTERCITAEGKVAGVEPAVRLQSRVEASAGEVLFPVKGVLGLDQVKVSGSVKVPALVASNTEIVGEGSAAFEDGYELCPGGTFKPAAGKERTSSGVTVGGKKEDPPLEKTRPASECQIKAPIPESHATAENNEDSRIGKEDEFYTEGKSVNSFSGPPKYELNLGSNGKLTLGGSKYYLCNFHAERAGELIIPKGAKVEIFIDSPETSTCPAGTGKFETEEFTLKNEAGPAALLIIMRGKGPFAVNRGATFVGSIYAPEASVTFKGGTKFKGGIVGRTVNLANGNEFFEWSEETGALTTGNPSGYSRQVWEQCTPGAGASEGC
jgi:Tfp pilus assembly protein PilX